MITQSFLFFFFIFFFFFSPLGFAFVGYFAGGLHTNRQPTGISKQGRGHCDQQTQDERRAVAWSQWVGFLGELMCVVIAE